jgi:lycopene cyclase domain-containing protein
LIAARYEYLFLLLVFAFVAISMLSARAQRAVMTPAFRISLVLFIAFGTAVDLVAIHCGWWVWSPTKTCGVQMLGIPVEEYILFVIGHLALVATWETLDDVA